MWEKYEIENPWFNKRFNYFKKTDGKGGTFYKRETKEWYKNREHEIEQIKLLLIKLEKNKKFRDIYPHGRADYHPLWELLEYSN